MPIPIIPVEIRTRVETWREMAARWAKISANDHLAAGLAYCAKELEEAIAIDEATARDQYPSSDSRPPKECYVYVIRRVDAGEVKIGISTQPMRRLHQLQSGHSQQLELVAHFVGGAVEEADLHERFKEFRKRGEWFHESPEISAWIEEIRS